MSERANPSQSALPTVRKVRMGGLMRCCLATLQDYAGPEDDGTVLQCQWCFDSMVVRDGAWEWNR